MATKVKTSVLHGAKDLRLEIRTLPPLSPSDVRISVKTTGLCGSDLHYYNHFRNGDILAREPLTLGHESAGIITSVGSAITNLAPGDKVALEVGQPCEQCHLCLHGRYNICPEMKFRSSAKAWPHAQGTLQEEIVHPGKWCHKLPEGVSLEDGALVEPMAVALHALRRARLEEGAKVLVFGAGTVGLLCAALSKVVNKAKVVIADIQEERVNFAVEQGFADEGLVVPRARPVMIEEKLRFSKEVAEMVGEKIGLVGGTFECTGVESCLQAAIYATAPGGKVMIIGMGNPVQTLPVSAASIREVDLVGVFRYANAYPKVIELLADGLRSKLPGLNHLITQRFTGIESIPNAFEMAGRVKDDDGNLVIKVLVNM
ncbi:chaperonin 10-like protein [Triangularia verruculosa]|uniref:Chaperonin 10-like protein n=1 Tax=Triangularia verruculosa TaxID=2587418 RepID=A0AAN6XH20_9PEZI|nr:chaperonin 10-like protein [Triangularia verruculosa]